MAFHHTRNAGACPKCGMPFDDEHTDEFCAAAASARPGSLRLGGDDMRFSHLADGDYFRFQDQRPKGRRGRCLKESHNSYRREGSNYSAYIYDDPLVHKNPAQNPIHAQDYLVARSVGSGLDDTYAVQLSSGEAVAWERMMDQAGWEDGESIEYTIVKATDAGAARLKSGHWRPLRARPRASMSPVQNPRGKPPKYPWFVVDRRTGLIVSGWETKSDAQDAEKEWREAGRNLVVMGRRTVGLEVLNPDDWASWEQGSYKGNPRASTEVAKGYLREHDSFRAARAAAQSDGRDDVVEALDFMLKHPQVNPAGLTDKGERMYEHIKKSYGEHPRAKEIAVRTVRSMAFEGTPGLIKKNPEFQRPKFPCPVCGEKITMTGRTKDGRVIGSCGDAFDGSKTVMIKKNPALVFPSVVEVMAVLKDLHREAKADIDAEEGLDVRLQVYEDGGWAVRYGDPGYDQDHHGYWGASTLSRTDNDFRAIAVDLIAQAEDQYEEATS